MGEYTQLKKNKMQKFILIAFDRFNRLITKNEINHVKSTGINVLQKL